MLPRSSLTFPSDRGSRTSSEEEEAKESTAAVRHSSSSTSNSSDALLSPPSHGRHQQRASTSSTISASNVSKPLHSSPFLIQQVETSLQQQCDPNNVYNPQQQHPQLVEPLSFPASLSGTTAMPRSSPIAIVRPPTGGNARVDDSDDDDEEDDDDDSGIDVEKDALKLQKKYGGKIVQTYQAPSTMLNSNNNSRNIKPSSILNAPYLGSLSKSANQVLSLPPMSLAGGTMYGNDSQLGEPPESIGGYGSLRDSHERGRFLDGPSSYREPTSGRIRQLDHRLRYHGRPPELSIGERMQQARKLKEIQQKEQARRNSSSDDGEKPNEKQTATSSLSAMMNEVSITSHSAQEAAGDSSSLGEEILIPVMTNEMASFRDDEVQQMMTDTSNLMLSTSLTAFEILKTTNVHVYSDDNGYRQSSSRGVTVPSGEANQTTPGDAAVASNLKQHHQHFQPLARSMSDPTPRFSQQMSSRTNNGALATTMLTPVQGEGSSDGNAPTISGWMDNQREVQRAPLHQPQMMTMSPQQQQAAANNSHAMFRNGHPTALPTQYHPPSSAGGNEYGFLSATPDHDPDTDGAFGDMDME
mmetsp:Transcript_5217/g.8238  ORF Transcript_5217/g.8238 Transcript_5217/m.8238 type:complete len:583 (+) Transcript_5217:67-1815(+)